jgi:two-component system, cell cycle sensor histidine kinase and response regulator CckA
VPRARASSSSTVWTPLVPALRARRPLGLLAGFAVLAAGLVVVGALYDRFERARLIAQSRDHLAAVAEMKAALLEEWLGQRLAASPEGVDPRAWLREPAEAGFLATLLGRWPVATASAETFLVERRPEQTTFLSPLRFLPRQPLPYTLRAAEHALALASVSAGESGFARGLDYRGEAVLSYVRALPVRGLALVAEVDEREVLAAYERGLRRLAAGLGAIYLLAFLLGLVAFRHGRRALATTLDAAERRFRAVFDRAGEGVFILDAEGRVQATNARARALLAGSADGVEGTAFAELLAPAEGELAAAGWQRIVERGASVSRSRLRRADGSTLVADVHLVRMPDGRFLGTVHDISDRHARELRERQARRLARLGGWEWDPRTGDASWDDEIFLMLGLDPARDEASYEAFLARVHAEDRPRVVEALRRALADREVFDAEFRVLLPSGAERWMRATGEVLRDTQQAPVRLVGVMQDLTDRRAAETALEATRGQLVEAQKMEAIGRFAGGVAHDFNNLIGVVLGNCDLATLELEEGHPARAALAEIRRAAFRAADLTRQLTSFARREPEQPRAIAAGSLVREAQRLVPPVIGERIELALEIDEPVGQVRLDPARMTQVLLNLAVNARDAMPDGGRLTIRCREVESGALPADAPPALAASRCVLIEVEDTGGGMDAVTAARCFEPFFTTKAPGAGTGLGLATVRTLVEGSGGQVRVRTAPGAGATFSIWLPRLQDEESDPVDAAESIAAAPRGAGEHVLVVDDAEAMREMVRAALVGLGYSVLVAASPDEALAALEREDGRIDLLLTDIIMGRGDGRELAMRAAERWPGLEILFMTGYADLPPGGVSFAIPAERLLEKPFTAQALAAKVRAVLDARPDAAPAGAAPDGPG